MSLESPKMSSTALKISGVKTYRKSRECKFKRPLIYNSNRRLIRYTLLEPKSTRSRWCMLTNLILRWSATNKTTTMVSISSIKAMQLDTNHLISSNKRNIKTDLLCTTIISSSSNSMELPWLSLTSSILINLKELLLSLLLQFLTLGQDLYLVAPCLLCRDPLIIWQDRWTKAGLRCTHPKLNLEYLPEECNTLMEDKLSKI